MRPVIITCLTLLVAAGSANAIPQEEPDPEAAPTDIAAASSAEAPSESLEELTVPGEPHELLAGTVGEWDLTFRVWSAPDTEPSESIGTATARWILGDRFVETWFEGEVMGRPFEALKIEGFEKATQEYVTTWRDNLGTYTMVFRGRCGTTCETRTMMAEFLDPVTNQRLKIRGVTTLEPEGGYSYESTIVTPTGVEFKNMELVAERRVP